MMYPRVCLITLLFILFALLGEVTGQAPGPDPAAQKLFEKAEALFREKKLEEALAALREAEKLAPNVIVIQMNLGGILGGLKRYSEAASAFRKAIRLDP